MEVVEPSTQSIDDNSEDIPSAEFNEDMFTNASQDESQVAEMETSPAPNTSEYMMDGENFCCVCKGRVGSERTCYKCHKYGHTFCRVQNEVEGYGTPVLCNNCKSAMDERSRY